MQPYMATYMVSVLSSRMAFCVLVLGYEVDQAYGRDIKNYLIERKEMWKYDKIYRIFLEMIRMKKILYTIYVWTLFIEKKFKCGMCNI